MREKNFLEYTQDPANPLVRIVFRPIVQFPAPTVRPSENNSNRRRYGMRSFLRTAPMQVIGQNYTGILPAETESILHQMSGTLRK